MPKRNAKASAERILSAAAELLEAEGWPGFGINQVVDRADLGKPLAYRYFGGRPGIEEELRHRVANILDLAQAGSEDGEAGEFRHLIAFGRALAANRLARDWLAGALSGHVTETDLTEVHQTSPENRAEATAHALLLAGIAFLLIWRDRYDSWAGVPVRTARDLAQFEYAVAALVGRGVKGE